MVKLTKMSQESRFSHYAKVLRKKKTNFLLSFYIYITFIFTEQNILGSLEQLVNYDHVQNNTVPGKLLKEPVSYTWVQT